jgi:hypothetical protein
MLVEASMVRKRKSHPKLVRSDLKDLTPSRRGAAFPHDREQTSPTRKNRRRLRQGARSTHVPRAVPRAENERQGGRNRAERKRRPAAG